MLLNLILLIVGFVLLIRGADYLVEGASGLAKKLYIPPIIIGLTVVAMGTSAPEAAVSITSALQGSEAIAIGNVLGSNIANILLILGLCAAVRPLKISKNTMLYENPFIAPITALVCAMGLMYGAVTRSGAGLLLGLFGLFVIYTIVMARKSECPVDDVKPMSVFKILVFIVGGLIALVLGSNITVSSATDIARVVGISERVIGLTIIALGTSLPELVTSIVATRKGQDDIAIGNIVGSNIFNILFVLGVAGLISPIPFDNTFLFDGMLAIAATMMLFVFTCRRRSLGRNAGILFVITYIAYITWLVVMK